MNYYSKRCNKEIVFNLFLIKNEFQSHSYLSFRPLLEIYFKEKNLQGYHEILQSMQKEKIKIKII